MFQLETRFLTWRNSQCASLQTLFISVDLPLLLPLSATVETALDGADGGGGGGGGALTMSLKKASRTKSLSLSGDDFPLRPTGGTGGSATGKPKATFATAKRPEDTLKIMKYIDDNVIGKGVAFLGPYGRRKDASGSLKTIPINARIIEYFVDGWHKKHGGSREHFRPMVEPVARPCTTGNQLDAGPTAIARANTTAMLDRGTNWRFQGQG
uniref:Uncharacterized protein n=1 Tax=Anopheles atroparvus TaxID=41427 RepID=A0A182ITE8_ANOAO